MSKLSIGCGKTPVSEVAFDQPIRDVEHLPNIYSNYRVALQILNDLYLNKPHIIDSLLHNIDSAPVFDKKNLEGVRTFISEVRANPNELLEIGLDILDKESAGCRLISHLVVDRLPPVFLRELKIVTGEEYPYVNIIFEKYHAILKLLEKLKGKSYFGAVSSSTKKPQSTSSSVKKSSTYTAGSRGGEENISKSSTKRNASSKKFSTVEHRTKWNADCVTAVITCPSAPLTQHRKPKPEERGALKLAGVLILAALSMLQKFDKPNNMILIVHVVSAAAVRICSTGAKAESKSLRSVNTLPHLKLLVLLRLKV